MREFYARTKELEESYVAGESICKSRLSLLHRLLNSLNSLNTVEPVIRANFDSRVIREVAVQLRIMAEWKAQNPKSPKDLILSHASLPRRLVGQEFETTLDDLVESRESSTKIWTTTRSSL